MSDKTEKAHGFKRFIEEFKRSKAEFNESHSGPGYGEWLLRNNGEFLGTALGTIVRMIREDRAEKEAQKQAAKENTVLPTEATKKTELIDKAESNVVESSIKNESEKEAKDKPLIPIDFSKIDFNHDGKPDLEQNIEEVMNVDVKQYVKGENTRDYIGDFDFAEDKPEIQEEQQVVQDYRSNRNRDDYDRDER